MKSLFGIFTFIALLSLTSCQKDHLENYFVQASENPDFLVVNLPSNLVSFDKDKLSKQTKNDLKKLKKFNIILYKNDYPLEQKKKEYVKLEHILSDYTTLIQVKNKGYKINFIYEGKPDDIEKLIFLGKDKNDNFMLGVLNTKGMDVQSIYEAVKHIKSIDNSGAKQVIDIIKED